MHEIKEMDLGGVFGTSFKLVFTKDFFKLSLFYLIFSIILFLALSIVIGGIAAVLIFTNIIDFNALAEFDFNSSILVILIVVLFYLILIIFTIFLITFLNGALIDLFSKTFLKEDWKIRECVKCVLKKFFRILFFYLIYGFITIIIGLIISIPFVLLAAGISTENIALKIISIPIMVIFFFGALFIFLILFTFFIIATPLIMNENKPLFQSISRSIKLVKPNFWSILGTGALFFIMTYFLLYIIQTVITLLIYFFFFIFIIISGAGNFENLFTDTTTSYVFIIVLYAIMFPLSYILQLIFYGLIASFKTTIFFNQKIRVEGFGVQLLAESMINEENNKLENVQES